MKKPPRVGSEFSRTFVVEPRHLISFADQDMPAVLSTPSLIAELEYTARDSVASLLDPHERTVGTAVEIRHMAPALPGATVTCRARVIGVNDSEIVFQVEASDSMDLLSRGVHRRHVIDVNRLRRRVERKQKQAGE